MADSKGSGFSLKDHLFNTNKVKYLAGLLRAADSRFEAVGFVKEATHPFQSLELKERIVHIAATLESYLAADFRAAARQIVNALPPPLDPRKTDDDFGDFIFAPFGEYVVRNGIAKRHLKLSLRTLQSLTQRFSMEDAIRQFINTHTTETMAELEKWSRHKNYHVRRLVSEGTRPRLPWSGRLTIDVEQPLVLLDALHSDTTRYVTRSVANHLNDITRQKPTVVLDRLKQWQRMGAQDPVELAWISKHALRTLVKQGHPEALKFLGFRPQPKIEVDSFLVAPSRLKPGQALEFSFTIRAKRDESLMVDYVIDFVKANGSLSPRVHKLKQVNLRKGESISLRKRHLFRANATTYTLYPGIHGLTLQINGQAYGRQEFELLKNR